MRRETPSASAAFDSDSAWRSRHSRKARTSPCPVADSVSSHSMSAPSSAPEGQARLRSEEHTSELQSLMRISYAVFCLKKKRNQVHRPYTPYHTQLAYPEYQ